MSLVGRVGRKRPRARLAMLTVYVALALGALTTLYPFVLMVATGLKGPTDQNDNRLVPAYLANMDSNDAAGKLDEGSLLSKFLADKYAGDASQIRSTRIGRDATAAQVEAYGTFLMRLPLDSWMAGFRTAPNQVTGRLAIRYQAWLRGRYGTVEGLNEAYTEQNGAFQQVVAPQEQLERRDWSPVRDRKFLEWLEFKATLPAEFRIPVRAQRMFQEFWRTQTHNQFDQVPPEVAGAAKAFEELALPRLRARWDEFVSQRLPARFAASTVESQWRSAIGAGTPLPIEATERAWVASNASLIRTEFASRNYAYVVDYVALHGRVLLNTLIFCLLAIATQLTVNPLAAYALSRFPLSSTYKLLVFLLATMAFPGEVAMIPSFLLLKDLGLLNTFAALVLPTAASGYMIYLLKGFFDSLPRELFEAGQIDGACETKLMTKLALPLSRPVLGYMGLLAFMGAYGAFMYAFLVAQDRRVWTLMVWIYQLQGSAPKAVMMAALTIAALPTLLVFLLAQRVILKGIVLPDER